MPYGLLLALGAITFSTGLAGCDDDPAPDADADADLDADADADLDADADDGGGDADDADAPPPRCADTTARLAVPTPAWHAGDRLSPPEGDLAAGVLRFRRASWFDQLEQLDGWPSRPTIVVPLSAAATAVDAAQVVAYGRTEPPAAPALLGSSFTASLAGEGRTLLLRPDRPFPEDLVEAIVVVRAGAVAGAAPLPACDAAGEPDGAYAEAAAEVGEPADALALPFRLSAVSGQLPALAGHLAAEPALEVAEIRGLALAEFGDAAPPPEVAALLADTAAWAILDLPDYRGPDGSPFVPGPDGGPEPQGVTSPGAIVVLPAAGAPPYPFVLFQHGGTQDKTDVLRIAGPLAAAGFAIVAVDLPFHGDRAAASGGTDMDIMDFNDPLRTRDNLRQASADHLAILTGVEELNLALEPVLGVAGALDADRAFYMGLSLGGITGSMTFASGRAVRAGALFVAAADYTQIVSHGLFGVLMLDLLDLPDDERAVALGLLEAFLEPADPMAYASRREDRAAPPRPLLLMQAVGDPVIAMPASDYWGLLFGADLAEPFHHEVAGMTALPLPAEANFAWTAGGETATRLLVQAPMAEVPIGERHGGLVTQPYSQELVAHCFRTFLDTGNCEAIDTGFAEH